MANIWIVMIGVLLAEVATINGLFGKSKPFKVEQIKGRLLTPEEGCGHSPVATTKIVGGAPAKNGQWPFVAMLGYVVGEDIRFGCAGSLVTSKHVLSAAHCFFHPAQFVRLGEYDMSTTSDGPHRDVMIKKVDFHEDFNGKQMVNDIAIVHMHDHVEFTDRIVPICLPIFDDPFYTSYIGWTPFIVGWGKTENVDKNLGSSVLMQLQVPVLRNSECKIRYEHQKRKNPARSEAEVLFDDRVICAGYVKGGKGPCFGDSGGPLMVPIQDKKSGKFSYYQIGIMSGSEGCAKEDILGIYVNIKKYAAWLHKRLS